MGTGSFDIVVCGGGAAGIMAALAASRAGATVAICEKDDRLGKTILATGNGRCNLSNTAITGENAAMPYHNNHFAAPTLKRCNCTAVRDIFETMGLLTFADENGWVYPRSRWANSVLNVLLHEVANQGITVLTGQEVVVVQLEHPVGDDGFRIKTTAGSLASRALVLAGGGFTTGEQPLYKGITNQPVVPPAPILKPLATNAEAVRGLDGVRTHCLATLRRGCGSQPPQTQQPLEYPIHHQQSLQPIAQETGEVLFRSYGVSGIAIFNLSRFAQPGHLLSLDFFPDFSTDELSALLNQRWDTGNYETWGIFLDGMLHTRLGQAVVRAAQLPSTEAPAAQQFDKLVQTLKDYRLTIQGGADSKQAQVTRGGWATEGFDPITLESRTYSGLFAAGECLDVDGPCGGFNLHWAWASGLVAGESAASKIKNCYDYQVSFARIPYK